MKPRPFVPRTRFQWLDAGVVGRAVEQCKALHDTLEEEFQ